HVSGAAAEVALQPLPDLVLGGKWVLLEQVGRRHDEAGGAVSALQAVLVPERLLDRVQSPVGPRQPLDRLDLVTVRLDREHRAGLRSEEHTSELQSRFDLVCRLLLEKKKYTEALFLLYTAIFSRHSLYAKVFTSRSCFR